MSRTLIFDIRIPRFIAVIVSFLALSSVITLFVITFIPLVSEQMQILKGIDYEEAFVTISSPIGAIENFLVDNNLTDQAPGFIADNLSASLIEFVKGIDFSVLLNSFIGYTGSFLIGLMAILFITFFLLYEQGIVRSNAIALIPNKYFEVSIAAVNKIEGLLSNYMLGLLFQMFAIFSIASIGLSILEVKYAITIALFAAVAILIPYAGPWFGASFGIIVGVSTGGGLEQSSDYFLIIVKIVSVFAVIQVTDNILLQPLIFSKSVKAHPLEIFVVIFAGATIAGVVGMIAAIPVYTILRVSVIELYKGYRQYHIFKIS